MFFLALILPFLAHAAGTPTITSISGDLTNGNIITVNGGNFIQMNTTNWIPFFQNNPNASNFGGASPAADGYSTQGPQGGVYDTSFYLMGTQSMRFDISGVSTTCPQDNLFSYNAILSGGGDAQDLWIRAYVAYDSADNLWIANQLKMFMCEGFGPGQYVYEPANWATLPSQMEADYDGMSHRANIPSGTLQNRRWYCMEVHWQTAAAPYVYQGWIDGVEIFNANPQTQGCLTSILFGLINACGTTSGFSVSNWFDGLAVSTSRVYPASTIQVGNSPTYGEGNEQYQQPIYLSDNQVQFVLNTSAVGPGPYYLWITNNSQATNDYYIVQAGDGSTGASPSASASASASAGGGGSGGGGGCFIATAAFGSYQEGHVRMLRQFRDTFLLTNMPGKAFVEWYYRHSPKYAGIIAGRPALRAMARTALLPLYAAAFLSLSGFLAPLILIVPCAALSYLLYRGRRRRSLPM
jgi:uncharacterized membrane protein YgcG